VPEPERGREEMRSQLIVQATLALDSVLFVVDLIVGLVSGSRAVESQAIYIVADLIGGILIVLGSVASQKPPDDTHPFGRGKERFFWAFSASLLTFSAAGLLVLVTALQSIAHPTPVVDLRDDLLVLAATILASLIGILVTVRELRIQRQSLDEFLGSSHLGLKTIFYQDLVSIFGGIVAFVGIVLIELTHRAVFDGLSAFGVGVLLMVTGILLAAESRELLVGKGISPAAARRILQLVERDARVRKVRELQSMMLGPEDMLVAMRVNFQDGLTTDDLELAIDQISGSVRSALPGVRHLLIEPES
jgi:cation diffusion facilitator family transporter